MNDRTRVILTIVAVFGTCLTLALISGFHIAHRKMECLDKGGDPIVVKSQVLCMAPHTVMP